MTNQKFAAGTTVRVVIDPYSHAQTQELLKTVYQYFGRDPNRWYWKHDPDSTAWAMLFVFRDPHDATVFSLKYSR